MEFISVERNKVILLSLFAATLQNIVNQPRRGNWNGFLTVKRTLDKSIQAPMVYRVLVPFLMRRNPKSLTLYDSIRLVLLWIALLCVSAYWGSTTAFVWLVFVMSAQIYDTWCHTGEAIGVTMALMGLPVGALLGTFIHGLSRETVLLNGFIYFVATGDILWSAIIAAFSACVFFGVRWYQGKHELYCERVMIKHNIKYLLKQEKPSGKEADIPLFYAPYLNVILIAVSLYGAYLSGWVGLVVPLYVAATFTFGKINEYRLNLVPAMWAAGVIAGAL